MQKFKESDTTEQKFISAAESVFDGRAFQRNLFYEDCYSAYTLGEILWDGNYAPLARAVKREIYREAFKEMFDAFIAGGTFESYLTVFRKIFGDGVTVTFTVPDPGKLTIDIESDGFLLSEFLVRYIEDNAYAFDEIIDDEGDNIVFTTVQGFETQYELEQMLFEMVPGGIFTSISLTVGV